METQESPPVRDKARTDRQKLKEMTFGKKLEYIWDYYKYIIIVAVIVAAVIGGALNVWLINPQPRAALFVSWNSGLVTSEQMRELSDILNERIVEEGVNEEVVLSVTIFDAEDETVGVANAQRTVAMIAAGVIDVFIMDDNLLDANTISGFIGPMEGLLEEIKTSNPMVYERIMENVVYRFIESEGNTLDEHILGVNIGRSPLFSKIGFTPQNLYFGISVSAGNRANTLEALIIIFE